MKRVVIAGVLALVAVLAPTIVAAQDTSQVSFVHASSAGAVDLYLGPESGPSVGLAAVGVAAGQVVDLGAMTSGKWRFLLCSHVANPAGSIATCSENGASTALDQMQTIGAGKTFDVVFGKKGGAGLTRFAIDTGCVSPGGRVSVGNVAASGPATVTLDGSLLSDSLAPGKMVRAQTTAGPHSLDISDGVALNLAGIAVDVAAQMNTVVYVAPGATSYTTYVHQVGLDCGTPPPTQAPTGTAAGSAPAVNANTTTAVNPTFAG